MKNYKRLLRHLTIISDTPYWRPDAGHRYAGQEAVTYPKSGAPFLRFEGHKYKISHVIWFYYTGKPPEHNIYTKDGNPMNFHYTNLYEAKSREYRPPRLFAKSNKKIPNFKKTEDGYTNGKVTFRRRGEAVIYHLLQLRQKYPKGPLDPVFEHEIIQSTDLKHIRGPENFNKSFKSLNHWINYRQSKGIHLEGATWQLLGTISYLFGFPTYKFEKEDIFRIFPYIRNKLFSMEVAQEHLWKESHPNYPDIAFEYHEQEEYNYINWQKFFEKPKKPSEPPPVIPEITTTYEAEYRAITGTGLDIVKGPPGCDHSLLALRIWVQYRVSNWMEPHVGYVNMLNLVLSNFDYPIIEGYSTLFYDLFDEDNRYQVQKIEDEQEWKWQSFDEKKFPVRNHPDVNTRHLFKDYRWVQTPGYYKVPERHRLYKENGLWTLKSVPPGEFFKSKLYDYVQDKPGLDNFAQQAAEEVINSLFPKPELEPEPEEQITVSEDFATALINRIRKNGKMPKRKKRVFKLERQKIDDPIQRAMDQVAETYGWDKKIRDRSSWDLAAPLFDEGIPLPDRTKAIATFEQIIDDWKDTPTAKEGLNGLRRLIDAVK